MKVEIYSCTNATLEAGPVRTCSECGVSRELDYYLEVAPNIDREARKIDDFLRSTIPSSVYNRLCEIMKRVQ